MLFRFLKVRRPCVTCRLGQPLPWRRWCRASGKLLGSFLLRGLGDDGSLPVQRCLAGLQAVVRQRVQVGAQQALQALKLHGRLVGQPPHEVPHGQRAALQCVHGLGRILRVGNRPEPWGSALYQAASPSAARTSVASAGGGRRLGAAGRSCHKPLSP